MPKWRDGDDITEYLEFRRSLPRVFLSDVDKELLRRKKQAYRKANPDLFAAHTASRHARKMRQRPPWVDVKAIRALYKEARALSASTGIKYHVDHIVPLKSDVVSGLHCLANLRIVKATENVRKSNSFEDRPPHRMPGRKPARRSKAA